MTVRTPCTVLLLLSFSNVSLGNEELVSLIRTGNQASRDAIRTIHARFETTSKMLGLGPKSDERTPLAVSAEWWQDQDRIKCVQRKSGQRGSTSIQEIVGDGKEIMSLTTREGPGTKKVTSAAIAPFKMEHFLAGDLWAHSLFAPLAGPRVTFVDLLEHASDVQKVETVSVNGVRCYRLLIKGRGALNKFEFDCTVDPHRGFLVTEFIPRSSSPTQRMRFEKRLLDTQRYAGNIHFPKQVETKSFLIKPGEPEKLMQVAVTTFTTVEINAPIAPSNFVMKIPVGTPTVDHRDGTSFAMGEGGAPTGGLAPIPADLATKVMAMPSYADAGGGWPTWATLAVGTALSLAAAAVIIVRTKRKHM